MRKELAKLCLDLVKYILTAIIISGLFSGLENNWAIYITAILLICFLTIKTNKIMSAQIIASFVGVGIIAAWAVFLIHQDNKKAKEAQKRASK